MIWSFFPFSAKSFFFSFSLPFYFHFRQHFFPFSFSVLFSFSPQPFFFRFRHPGRGRGRRSRKAEICHLPWAANVFASFSYRFRIVFALPCHFHPLGCQPFRIVFFSFSSIVFFPFSLKRFLFVFGNRFFPQTSLLEGVLTFCL